MNFDFRKKEDQVARIGVMGGGLGESGNARKKTFFFFVDPFPYAALCQDGLCSFLAHFGNVKKNVQKRLHGARLAEGEGSKAFWAMPIWKQHISKGGFPKRSNEK